MAFEGQYATGESMLRLENSEVFKAFKGTIRELAVGQEVRPAPAVVSRRNFLPTRVVAIDGSTVTADLRNGLPLAEATLLTVSIVSIDLRKLRDIEDPLPNPSVFYDMEKASTYEGVLPGANVVRRDFADDTPSRYFREQVFDLFKARLDASHEPLNETVRAMARERPTPRPPRCPIEGCNNPLTAGFNEYVCGCERSEKLFETDAFRFVERFSENASNGEAHGLVRHILEVASLINFLRYFAASPDRLHYLRDNVFVLDGPLAVFGPPAWLAPLVRAELTRINTLCREQGGFDLAVFGFEKTGAFVEHFERLDFDANAGPRSKYAPGSTILPDASYINRYIALRPADAKPHGADTYFGRKVFYKTASGEHAVITTAMVNEASQDFRRTDQECYPRLGDMLDVLDHLATYLYRDGFMPLVRAHAHAAIPLRLGTDVIRSLFS